MFLVHVCGNSACFVVVATVAVVVVVVLLRFSSTLHSFSSTSTLNTKTGATVIVRTAIVRTAPKQE